MGHELFKDLVIYKYNEGAIIQDVKKLIDETYTEHYAKGEIESMEVIIDSGHGWGFCIGNILKYAKRIGHKDSVKKELLKIIHYAIIALYILEKEDDKTV